MRLAARRRGLWIRQVLAQPVIRIGTPFLVRLAWLWRRVLVRTTFIAITGSVGKTTTKEILGSILEARAPTYRTTGNQNGGFQVAMNLLRVRPWHRFAVLELGIDSPGSMQRLAPMVRPDLAIMISIANVHTKGFKNREEYIAEKSILLNHVAEGGLAILNGDDPVVAGMAQGLGCRVACFGSSPKFELWADGVSCRWPERLSFRAHRGQQTAEVTTMLLGEHWVSSMLAALSAACHLGMDLSEAAGKLLAIPPYTARLEPVALASGAVVVRDDYSASIDTFGASLRFLEQARAQRRVLVMSDVSDSGMNSRGRLKHMAAAVSTWLELLVLVGREHAYGRRKAIEAGMPPARVHSFENLQEAAEFLRNELGRGDLVLLKGRTTDHLARLFFAQVGSIACWKRYCRRTMLCDGCWELDFEPEGDYVPPSAGVRV
jgi:UDP-N-acetylmuramoyl-tripeptide--D-alanyl-D-alanine ligase